MFLWQFTVTFFWLIDQCRVYFKFESIIAILQSNWSSLDVERLIKCSFQINFSAGRYHATPQIAAAGLPLDAGFEVPFNLLHRKQLFKIYV